VLSQQFLRDIAVLLAASFPLLFLARALRLPPILGFLLTGVIIGPHSLGLLRDPRSVEEIAELGVVLILFFVGLEFPIDRLRGLGKSASVSGTVQILLTVAAVSALTAGYEGTLGTAIFYGFLVAFSSTAVILPILSSRDELFSPYGSRTLGVLLLQDLAVIPIMLLLPALQAGGDVSTAQVLRQVVISTAGIALIILAARYLLPLLMKRIGWLGEEGFTGGVVILVVAMVSTAQWIGVSAAMGAFAAGIVLAETDYVHKIIATLRPFRDLLSSLFFASIGMLLDPSFVLEQPLMVAGIVTAVIVLKALLAYPAFRLASALPATALRASLALANVGEFSFVLAQAGSRLGLLSNEAQQFFVTAAVVTIALAPLLVHAAHRLSAMLPVESSPELQTGERMQKHVVVVGYGLNGRNVAHVLSETSIAHIVVDEDPDRIADARARGSRALLSDASVPHTLEAAGIGAAHAVVIAISAPEASRRIVRLCRLMNPDVRIIVRTRYVSEVEALRKEGADEVIPEEFETSIEIVTRVLRVFHVPGNVLAAQLRLLRNETYRILRDPSARLTEGRKLSALLAAGTSETFLVLPGTAAEGRTLAELGLDSDHIAVPALMRDGLPIVSPPPELTVQSGDILLLVGAHEDLSRTISRLEEEPQ